MKRHVWSFVAVVCVVLFLGGCTKAGDFFKKGREAFVTGDYENALLYYSQALEENPNKSEYYIEKGHCLLELGRYEEARTTLVCAVVDQELELTRKNNKRAQRAIGIAYYEEGVYAEAISYFEKALEEELLPELDTDIRMYLADALECKGDYGKAIALYDTILSEKKDYTAGYRARGYMNYIKGNYEASLLDYDAAITLEPENFELYLGKYNVLDKLGKKTEQAELTRVLATITPPSAKEGYDLAKAQYFCEFYEEALESLQTATENGFEEAHYYLGEIYLKRSVYEEAAAHFKQYISGSGAKDAATYNQLGVCLMKQEKYAEALRAIQAGQRLNDEVFGRQLLFNEIVIFEKMGEYNTAYEKAVGYRNVYPEDEIIHEELEFLATRVREES